VFGVEKDVEGPIAFGRLGYADAALESWEIFQRALSNEEVSREARFQVSLPTPFAVVGQYVELGSQAAVEAGYKAQLFAELDEIQGAIPHERLALQWDVAVEFAVLEGLRPVYFEPVREGLIARLIEDVNRVARDVQIGLHLCYGDAGHKHFKEPEDTRHLVDVANAVAARVSRPIHWIHMPVPRDRADDAYFAPLEALRLSPDTELYLGLVHMTDGLEGSCARMAAAKKVIGTFGVATECGFGRRSPETVADLLHLHKELVG